MQQTATADHCEQALDDLLRYCRSQGWAGYDPYDGLNSPLARNPLLNNSTGRTVLTQLIKRSPLNLRPFLGIKKGLNPKGLALAARSVVLLARSRAAAVRAEDGLPEGVLAEGRLRDDFDFLIGSLDSLRISQFDEACWGYNFDWQSRAFFAPRGTPNVVCTAFAAQAYLDWHEWTGSQYALETATSSGRFLLKYLNRTIDGPSHCFSYTPLDHARVHNVNLLAAQLLARLGAATGETQFKEGAAGAVRYSVARQAPDGSWPYGEARRQAWIDSFHTGFVLVALKHIIEDLGQKDWQPSLARGYEFYRDRFFLADSTPKYYHDKLYPIDVHAAAQAVITFVEMSDLIPATSQLATRAVRWAITNLRDPAGFFYFQRHRFHANRVDYMRWSQAWMLYALSLYFSRGSVRQYE